MPNIQEKVYENSLQTCEYVSGYQNIASVIKVKCIKHNYEFETKYENIRRDNRKHHICPICQQEDKKALTPKVQCAYCHKEFNLSKSKMQKSKSGLHFCCREHKDLAQRLESGAEFSKMRPIHYRQNTEQITINNYRLIALRHYSKQCSVCGWNEDDNILEVHHIDENRQNNDIDNLIVLCPICHRKLTSHKYTLINRNLITPI